MPSVLGILRLPLNQMDRRCAPVVEGRFGRKQSLKCEVRQRWKRMRPARKAGELTWLGEVLGVESLSAVGADAVREFDLAPLEIAGSQRSPTPLLIPDPSTG